MTNQARQETDQAEGPLGVEADASGLGGDTGSTLHRSSGSSGRGPAMAVPWWPQSVAQCELLNAYVLGNPVPMYLFQRQYQHQSDDVDWVLMDFNAAADDTTVGLIALQAGESAREVFDDYPEIIDDLDRCAAERISFQREISLTLPVLTLTRYLVATYAFVAPDVVMVLTEDITERKIAEEALHMQDARFRALVQHATDVISVIDTGPDGAINITYVSPSVMAVLGYSPDALLGPFDPVLIHPDDLSLLELLYQEIYATPRSSAKIAVRLKHRDLTWKHMEIILTNLRDEPGVQGVVLNMRDVTERHEFEEQLKHQAFHDPLTGLPNRALFLDRLNHALTRAMRHTESLVAVLFLDLDRFKIINDSLGHGAGDQLLMGVSQRLTACVRAIDTIARFGGDEFAILLADLTQIEEATRTADRILGAIAEPFVIEGHEMVTKTSIGIVTSTPQHGTADMMRDADVALYRAKGKGRGCYEVFDATMNARAMERLKLENDLRRAVERREFAVYYQPKVDLASGCVRGMEALVRWIHPERGVVLPSAFIELAEETGLIDQIGGFVLWEACHQTQRWNAGRDLHPLIISINLSAHQFARPTIISEVAQALAASRVDPHHIQLEITESVAMGEAETTVATLQRLKELGVRLAIDDFGTGYSSLAYLKRFPVDTLKIDRGFISGLQHNSDDASIVNAVVSLGRALHLTVVAEGVESQDESAHVRSLGCDQGQGFFFTQPLPLSQIEQWMASIEN